MTAFRGSDYDGSMYRFTGNEAELQDGPVETIKKGVRKRLR